MINVFEEGHSLCSFSFNVILSTVCQASQPCRGSDSRRVNKRLIKH